MSPLLKKAQRPLNRRFAFLGKFLIKDTRKRVEL